jgi:hypothetical protein
MAKTVSFTLENRSGYATRDLRRFFARGLRALHVRQKKHIVVFAAPKRSRGCAQIGQGGREGKHIIIAIASPSHFSLRRLARLFEHEVAHTLGLEHERMRDSVLWSLGPIPAWAKGCTFQYKRRAPRQL